MKIHERSVRWLFYEHLRQRVTRGWAFSEAFGRAIASGQAKTSVDGVLQEVRGQCGAYVSLLWDQPAELLSVEGPLRSVGFKQLRGALSKAQAVTQADRERRTFSAGAQAQRAVSAVGER